MNTSTTIGGRPDVGLTEAETSSNDSNGLSNVGSGVPSACAGGSEMTGSTRGRLPLFVVRSENVNGWSPGTLVCDVVFTPLAVGRGGWTANVAQASPAKVPVPSPRPASPVMPAQLTTPGLVPAGRSSLVTPAFSGPLRPMLARASAAIVGLPSASTPE